MLTRVFRVSVLIALMAWGIPAACMASLVLQVNNEATGEAVAGVKVAVSIDGTRTSLTTDDQGRASIPFDHAPNPLRITANKDHYVPVTIYWRGSDRTAPASVPETYTLSLSPGVTVGGIIQNEKGQPISGADVFINITDPENDSEVPSGRPYVSIWDYRLKADADGKWICDFAPAKWATFEVRPAHPDYISEPMAHERPSAESLRGRTAVTVMKQGATLRGRVVDTSGKPIRGAAVSFNFDNGSLFPTTRSTTDGTFRMMAKPGSMEVLVRAPKFAPVVLPVTLTADSDPLDVHLSTARKVTGRLVDPTSRPVSGAWVGVTRWGNHDMTFAGARARSDAAGRFSLDSDDQPISIDVLQRGSVTIRERGLDPMGANVIVVAPELHVVGTVTDAVTGKPVEKFSLTPGQGIGEVFWLSAQTIKSPAGQFSFTGDEDNVRVLRIGADGYQPVDSKLVFGSAEMTLDVKLKRGAPIAGTVLTPTSQPAGGAEITLAMPTSQSMIQNGHLSQHQNFSPTTHSDGEGHFSFDLVNEKWLLIVLHDSGYARISPEQLAGSNTIVLTPWARIEGTLRVGAKPLAKGEVALRMSEDDREMMREKRSGPRIHSFYNVTCDDSGHFVLDRVPAGEGHVSRQIQVSEGRFTLIGSTNPQLVNVKSGQRLTVDIGGVGRPVIGKAVLPDSVPKGSYVISHCSMTTPPRREPPHPPDISDKSLTAQQRRKLFDDWRATDEFKAFQAAAAEDDRRRLYFSTPVSSDGTFRFEDISPGTYSLDLRAEQASHGNAPGGSSMVMVTFEFTVAPMPGGRSDEPQDLGVIRLKPLGPE